jgi:uncharacterized caspase-like protein
VKILLSAACLLFLLVATTHARAEPIRILLAAGAPSGTSGDQPLLHPLDDARAVQDVFTSIGGVAAVDALLVSDPTAASLRASFDRAEALARGHSPQEVTFLFYFSGHGDHEALHLTGEAFSIQELQERVARLPAALRLVVVDACRTRTDRAKGMTTEPGFPIALSSVQIASGVAWLFASTDGEVAQESDEIGGALFSHFWATGLRGAADSNGDGRVTLQESFDFAYAQTLLQSARSGAALQRPQERLELTEAGPVVLTALSTNRATLVLPPDRDALYLVYGASSRSLEAELYAQPDRTTSIGLTPGRYVVQRRVQAAGGVTEVMLAAGDQSALDVAAFRPFAAAALALKGELWLRPWSVALFDGVFGGVGLDVGEEGGLEVERRWGHFAGALRGFGGWGERTTAPNHVYETAAGGEAAVDRVVPLTTRMDLRLGLDLRGEWIRQQVTRRDAAQVEALGYPATAYFAGTAWGGGAHAALRWDLSTTWYMRVQTRALGLGAKTDTGAEGRFLVGAYLGLGAVLP